MNGSIVPPCMLACRRTSPCRLPPILRCSPMGGGAAAAPRQWQLVALGVGSGLVGYMIDSLLGATIQFTGYNRKTGAPAAGSC